MPNFYVYAASDFEEVPPVESVSAAGSGPFSLQLKADAVPTLVEVDDNDLVFDEVDYSQALAEPATIGGVGYPAGTTIQSAYDLINTGSGHKVTSLHLEGHGYHGGAVDGIISNVQLEPGVSYSFDVDRTSHRENNLYDDYVACFTSGAMVLTSKGRKSIDDLRVGECVETKDHGLQPILWIGRRTVPAIGSWAPVVFEAGVLGNPKAMALSPAHRILRQAPDLEVLFESAEVLVPAKSFVGQAGVTRKEGGVVTYIHLLLPQHELIDVDGVWSESLFLGGSEAGSSGLREALGFFPTLKDIHHQPARRILRGFEAELL